MTATDRRTVDYIVDQIARAGAISAKAIFGEYGLYSDGKMFAIIGDDQVFVKQRPAVKRSRPTRR